MDTSLDSRRDTELLDVRLRRYDEARDAGLSHEDAEKFSESSHDIGELRYLVKCRASPDLIARIVL